MTNTARRAAVGAAVMVAVIGWTSRAAATESAAAVASGQSLMAPEARVRSSSSRIMGIIIEAVAQSETFRGLVDQIGTTDGFVYVEEGPCGHGVHACLLFTITMAGPNRVLRIHVDSNKPDRDLMASVGHELQHAVEVLSNRTIKSGRAMYSLYFEKCHRCGGAIETYAAIRAGTAVREELQKSEKSPIIDPQKATVVIRVNNVVGIEAGLLQLAEVRATDVFRQIGVRLTWVDIPTLVRQHSAAMCTVVLVNEHQNPGPYSDVHEALGYAAPELHRAWIFWDRIDARSSRSASVAIVLGDAIAHELGHLMLSTRAHSVEGIMRPGVELRFRSTETFTKSQARDILTRLEQACTVTDSNH